MTDSPEIPLPLTQCPAPGQAVVTSVTPEIIASIVDSFYAACRTHHALGPIFNSHVKDWPAHLAQIRAFWAAAILHTGGYAGRPLQAHLSIPHLTSAHFSAWLKLFSQSLDAHTPPLTEADANLFRAAAGRMANRFMAAADQAP